ncbi:MAG: RING finger protein [Oscillospiraceae bacterium]
MSRFTHKLCPVCKAPFGEDDDIVVCPECGTPHHRACWEKSGSCGVQQYHAEGFTWQGRLPDEETAPEDTADNSKRDMAQVLEEMNREREENTDPHHAEYPQGTPIMEEPVDMNKFAEEILESSRNPSDERGEDGVSMHELYSYSGGNLHYLSAFSLFRLKEMRRTPLRNISVNLCAGLLQPLNQFYRRLDGLGVFLTIWAFASVVPSVMIQLGCCADNAALLNGLSALQLLLNIISFLLTAALCLYGDYFYYLTAVRRIKRIRAAYDDGRAEGYYERLEEKGRPSILRMIIAVLAISIITACITLFVQGMPAMNAVSI